MTRESRPQRRRVVRAAQRPRFAGSGATMRIRLPATRSPPCLDARSRGCATIANPGESIGVAWVPGGDGGGRGCRLPGASGARRERKRPEAIDRSGIAGSVSEGQLERRARAEGIAIIERRPAANRSRKFRPGSVPDHRLSLRKRAPDPRPRERAAGPQGRRRATGQKKGRRARRRPVRRKQCRERIRTGFPGPIRWRVRGRSRSGRRCRRRCRSACRGTGRVRPGRA